MFNPSYEFTGELLDAFIRKEVQYFVKSSYERGLTDDIQEAYLVTHYHAQSEAERHYNVIPQDKQRQLYDLSKTGDVEKLRMETLVTPNRQSFSILMHPDSEKRANNRFKDNTRRYLTNHTHWDLTGRVTIYPKFRFQLGVLFVRIYHEGDEIIVPFKDIENS
jgi:hypothetical protein